MEEQNLNDEKTRMEILKGIHRVGPGRPGEYPVEIGAPRQRKTVPRGMRWVRGITLFITIVQIRGKVGDKKQILTRGSGEREREGWP